MAKVEMEHPKAQNGNEDRPAVRTDKQSNEKNSWWWEVDVEEAFETAREFIEKNKIMDVFDMTPAQADLFSCYFVGYSILKSNRDNVEVSRGPNAQAMRRLPILSWLVGLADDVSEKTDRRGKDFIKLGDAQAELIRGDEAMPYAEFLMKGNRTEWLLNLKHSGGRFVLTVPCGKPDGIRNLANILSTASIENKKDAKRLQEIIDWQKREWQKMMISVYTKVVDPDKEE